MPSYPLTVGEIEAAIGSLAGNGNYAAYLQVSDLPNRTPENRAVKSLRVGRGTVKAMVVGGLHAREWAPPDAVLGFVEKLLEAYRTGSPFTDSSFRWPASPADPSDPGYTGAITFPRVTILDDGAVRRIVDRLQIYFVPCANPDGRAFTLTGRANRDWRKNRRNVGPAAPCGALGVDLNRNFPTAWNYRAYYTTAALANTALRVEDDACAMTPTRDLYHGPAAGSEPETQNIMSLVDNEEIRFYLDVHAFYREMYYSWGINPNQTTDDAKTFLNSTLDRNIATGVGGRPMGNAATYAEYFPSDPFLQSTVRCVTAMRDRVIAAAGSNPHAKKRSGYAVKQAYTLYASPGDSADYAFGKQLQASGNRAVTNSRHPVFSFTMEAGTAFEGGFHPSALQYRKIQREIWAAMAAFLSYAATWRAPASGGGPPGGGGGGSPGGGSGSISDAPVGKVCFITTAVYGALVHPTVQSLRYFRDHDMQKTPWSAGLMRFFTRQYDRFSPALAAYLGTRPRATRLVRYGVLEPLAAAIRFSRLGAQAVPSPGGSTLAQLLLLLLLPVSGILGLGFLVHQLLG